MARPQPDEWVQDGMLEWRHLGGSWEVWRCRLCGATTDRHFDEHINEYTVHACPEAAERCMERWERKQRRAHARSSMRNSG